MPNSYAAKSNMTTIQHIPNSGNLSIDSVTILVKLENTKARGTLEIIQKGVQYWIVPQNCHHSHGGYHDVAFNHWKHGNTDVARSITTGVSAGASYE